MNKSAEKELFSLSHEYKRYLKDCSIKTELRKAFKNNKQSLSNEAKKFKEDVGCWVIEDGLKRYRIKDIGTELKIYLEECEEPSRWYKFPLFYGFVFFLSISVILFLVPFFITIPETLLIPLYSVVAIFFVFGFIIFSSVSFYYSFMTKDFIHDMKVLRCQMDRMIGEIEKDALFKFEKITLKFRLPFMRMETELVRKKDSEAEKSNK